MGIEELVREAFLGETYALDTTTGHDVAISYPPTWRTLSGQVR